MWPKESIPDPDKLFMRVHDSFVREGTLIPGVFRERGEGELKGMSTDWDKYSTSEESRNRSNVPLSNSIISFIVGNIRSLELFVDHAPEDNNRAHTNIKGIDTQMRLILSDSENFDWEIKTNKITV